MGVRGDFTEKAVSELGIGRVRRPWSPGVEMGGRVEIVGAKARRRDMFGEHSPAGRAGPGWRVHTGTRGSEDSKDGGQVGEP